MSGALGHLIVEALSEGGLTSMLLREPEPDTPKRDDAWQARIAKQKLDRSMVRISVTSAVWWIALITVVGAICFPWVHHDLNGFRVPPSQLWLWELPSYGLPRAWPTLFLVCASAMWFSSSAVSNRVRRLSAVPSAMAVYLVAVLGWPPTAPGAWITLVGASAMTVVCLCACLHPRTAQRLDAASGRGAVPLHE